MTIVARPLMTRPPTMNGRRPTRSDSRPDTVSPTALPAAKTASVAVPATHGSLPMTTAANSGRIALRTPKLAHPLAKADPIDSSAATVR